jgi:hypothetical protein
MKTILKNMLGWGSALALVAGCTSTAVVPGNKAAMACTNCKTELISEYRPSPLSGKIPDRYVTIGSKHECAACGGAITTVRGKPTDDMKSNCPICAKAKTSNAACCTTSN